MNDERTGKTTTVTKVVSDEIFAGAVSMVDDNMGGYYNQRSWHDKQTTLNVNIDSDGNRSVTGIKSKLVGDARETTSGPLMNSSAWANYSLDLPEWQGEGGLQKGGFYLTSEDGGADPTKFTAASDAQMVDVTEILAAFGAKGKGLKIPKNVSVPDVITSSAAVAEEVLSGQKQASQSTSGGTYTCPTCNGNFPASDTAKHNESLGRKSGPFTPTEKEE